MAASNRTDQAASLEEQLRKEWRQHQARQQADAQRKPQPAVSVGSRKWVNIIFRKAQRASYAGDGKLRCPACQEEMAGPMQFKDHYRAEHLDDH